MNIWSGPGILRRYCHRIGLQPLKMSCAKAGTSSAIPSTMSIIKTTSPERTICLPSISKIFGVSAAGKAAVEPVSAAALLGVGGSGNANVSVDVGPGTRRLSGTATPGRKGPCPELPPGPAGWCGCSRKSVPCQAYALMEQLPQRESVPQIAVFHTPRLRNITIPIQGYRVPTTRHPSTEWAFPQAVDLKPNRSCRIILGHLLGAEP